jgi:regulator of cell morphogenesis and NO signaling
MEMLSATRTLGSIVNERPERARVLERFGLDYCCGGKRSLADACEQKSVDPIEVLREIYELDHEIDVHRHIEERRDWSNAPATELIEHIVSTHHKHTKEELARLGNLAVKVAAKHSNNRPELTELLDLFRQFRDRMLSHMFKEENVLFPMIEQLEKASVKPQFHCGSLRSPISVMQFEHEDADRDFTEMKRITGGLVPPADACNSYRALFAGILDLERDLHMHVNKENNILFPRAIEMENGKSGKSCCA